MPEAVIAACRREFVRVARSFWLIPEILPSQALDDVALLYCFCRELDDAVDEAADATHARAAIDQIRAELEGRVTPRPLTEAFLESASRNRLPLECLEALLDGMASDLGAVRMASDAALLLYAYRVSAAVGLMLAPLLGVRGVEAEARVVDLGLALQLSNVILGVQEDARRGRVYLPVARLAAAGLGPEDVLASPGHRRLLPVLGRLARLADLYYDSAALGSPLIPLRYRHGVLLLAGSYRDLGWRAARGEPPLKTPGQLPLAVKAARFAELLLTALRPRVLGLLPSPPHAPWLHSALTGRRGAHASSPRLTNPEP